MAVRSATKADYQWRAMFVLVGVRAMTNKELKKMSFITSKQKSILSKLRKECGTFDAVSPRMDRAAAANEISTRIRYLRS